MMVARRGLTLLEVLLATVLLAALAAASVPLVRSSASILGEPLPVFDLTDLNAIVDAIESEPEGFSIDFESLEGFITIQWPDYPDRPAVHAYRFRSSEHEAAEDNEESKWSSGFWMIYVCGPWQTYRWHAEARTRDDAESNGQTRSEAVNQRQRELHHSDDRGAGA
jgi:prepilin-type N-terminal cleavage/methylation domain-containing protein